MFLRRPGNLLSSLDRSTSATKSIPGTNKPRLSIGFDVASVSIRFFQALRELGANHTALELSLICAEPEALLDLLRSEVLDTALITATTLNLSADLVSIPLPRRQHNVLLPTEHHLAKAMQIDLALMNNDNLIVCSVDNSDSNRELALRACKRAGFSPAVVIETNSYASTVGLVAAGRGYAIFPEDPNLNAFRSVMSMVPILQTWDSPGTQSLRLRNSYSLYLEEFLKLFYSKHRSR